MTEEQRVILHLQGTVHKLSDIVLGLVKVTRTQNNPAVRKPIEELIAHMNEPLKNTH